jgi:hypothetical protein
MKGSVEVKSVWCAAKLPGVCLTSLHQLQKSLYVYFFVYSRATFKRSLPQDTINNIRIR